jgi:hypothetical protein
MSHLTKYKKKLFKIENIDFESINIVKEIKIKINKTSNKLKNNSINLHKSKL